MTVGNFQTRRPHEAPKVMCAAPMLLALLRRDKSPRGQKSRQLQGWHLRGIRSDDSCEDHESEGSITETVSTLEEFRLGGDRSMGRWGGDRIPRPGFIYTGIRQGWKGSP